MAKRMVRAKVFRVGCASSIEEIDASVEGLQAIVGGYVEGIHLDPQHVNHHILYCNEDGRTMGLPPNLRLPNGVVVLGDAVMVLHDSDGNAIPFTEPEPEAICMASRHLAEDGSEMNAHTPTPWKKSEKLPSFDAIVGANGEKLFWYTPDDDGIHIKEKDAAFIVKAANNHERLQKERNAFLSDLKYVLQSLERLERMHGIDSQHIIVPLKKTIAQAEGWTQKEPYEKPAIRAGTPKETE